MIRKMLVIGHRGASDLLQDNTILSFDRALIEKADMIELDVRKTADGQLVLFHDWYLSLRCNAYKGAGVSRMVSHASFDQIRECCTENGFQLATLEEVLSRYGNRIGINIELKAGGYEKEVLDLVYRYDIRDTVVLSSFAPWVVRKLKDLDNSVKTGWIVGQERILKANRGARIIMSWIFERLGADSAHLHYEIVTPEVLDRFHSRGIPVYAWTVNDIEDMKHLIEIGIDGIITNKPGALRSLLSEEAAVSDELSFAGSPVNAVKK